MSPLDDPTPASVDWQSVAYMFPGFVSWVVQTKGPIPDGERLTEAQYNELKKEYEAR